MKKIKRTIILAGLLSLGFAGSGLAGRGGELRSWCKQGKGFVLTSAGLIGMLCYGNDLTGVILGTKLFRCNNTPQISMKLLLLTYCAMEGVEMIYKSS